MAGHGKDPLQKLFSRHGLRCTTQRRALYECLAASCCHPTADQLFYEVGGKVKGMSLATVYNTLDAFCRAGLARKLPGKGASMRYDASVNNHVHTRCQKTGAIHDVPEDLGRKLLTRLPKDTINDLSRDLGFDIQRVQIELIGQWSSR